MGAGFAGVALAGMLANDNVRSADTVAAGPLAMKPPHFAPVRRRASF